MYGKYLKLLKPIEDPITGRKFEANTKYRILFEGDNEYIFTKSIISGKTVPFGCSKKDEGEIFTIGEFNKGSKEA